jgi:hypothetical protein
MVGRKSRRVHDGPSRLCVSAPDLSRGVGVPRPWLARTRERAKLHGTPHPNGSNPARFSQQGGWRCPRRDFRPTAPAWLLFLNSCNSLNSSNSYFFAFFAPFCDY